MMPSVSKLASENGPALVSSVSGSASATYAQLSVQVLMLAFWLKLHLDCVVFNLSVWMLSSQYFLALSCVACGQNHPAPV